MAIDADIILCDKADRLSMPPIKVLRAAGAGFVDFDIDADSVAFRNLSTSQTVFIRLNLDADATVAATGDNKSVRVEAGETFVFNVTNYDLSTCKLSVQ